MPATEPIADLLTSFDAQDYEACGSFTPRGEFNNDFGWIIAGRLVGISRYSDQSTEHIFEVLEVYKGDPLVGTRVSVPVFDETISCGEGLDAFEKLWFVYGRDDTAWEGYDGSYWAYCCSPTRSEIEPLDRPSARCNVVAQYSTIEGLLTLLICALALGVATYTHSRRRRGATRAIIIK